MQQHLMTKCPKWDGKNANILCLLGRSENLRLVFGLMKKAGSRFFLLSYVLFIESASDILYFPLDLKFSPLHSVSGSLTFDL